MAGDFSKLNESTAQSVVAGVLRLVADRRDHHIRSMIGGLTHEAYMATVGAVRELEKLETEINRIIEVRRKAEGSGG